MSSAVRGGPRNVRRVATVVLVCGDAEVASWPLAALDCPDVAVVNELARLQLAARRLGCSIRLHAACTELCELLDLVGLGELLSGAAGLCRQPGGQAEGGEQVGVEEIVMPDDPVP
jgi:ABC-type transporter Mla MlaB component